MQFESMKGWTGWVVALIAILALIVVLLARDKTSQTSNSPQITNSHGLTVKFDPKGGLVFLDAQGNPIKPVKLDPQDPIGDLFKSGPLEDIQGTPATVLSFKKNPYCNPTFIFGSWCSAPHPACCE